MYFDGSDISAGVAAAAIDGMQVLPDGSILLSFAANVTLTVGGVNNVNVLDEDIVKFSPTSTGLNTAGTFTRFFSGGTIGLTQATEDIDAFFYRSSDSRLFMSTDGAFSTTPTVVAGGDQDVFACTLANPGPAATCTAPAIFLDGDDLGLTAGGNEDIDGFSVAANGDISFSTVGAYATTGAAGANNVSGTTGNDIVTLTCSSTGGTTTCATRVRAVIGNNIGLTGKNIKGFQFN
jgi:hypothetical protein